mmetsp:Transcript_15770/g.36213  ORF Transcript_15770/g.36213 Transcript_15770/m.36213 type:complete len:207 (+) Transcript_15770:386-1006(+)
MSNSWLSTGSINMRASRLRRNRINKRSALANCGPKSQKFSLVITTGRILRCWSASAAVASFSNADAISPTVNSLASVPASNDVDGSFVGEEILEAGGSQTSLLLPPPPPLRLPPPLPPMEAAASSKDCNSANDLSGFVSSSSSSESPSEPVVPFPHMQQLVMSAENCIVHRGHCHSPFAPLPLATAASSPVIPGFTSKTSMILSSP